MRNPRWRNSDASGASSCGALILESSVSVANLSIQRTDPINWTT